MWLMFVSSRPTNIIHGLDNYRTPREQLIADEEIILDENGNPVAPPRRESEATEPQTEYYDE